MSTNNADNMEDSAGEKQQSFKFFLDNETIGFIPL